MQRWPCVDPGVRRRLLDEVRRRQHRQAALLSPQERIAQLDGLYAFAQPLAREGRGPGSDESVELWLRMKARFRSAGG